MKEEWKDIPGYEGLYQVSNLGRIKSLARKVKTKNGHYQGYNEKILKMGTNNSKYYMVVLCKNGKTNAKLVHRIVAEAFIPNPDNKPCVDHIDTNIYNNNVNNLRWCSQKENCLNPITRKNNSKSKMGLKKGIKLSKEHKQKISIGIRKHYKKESFKDGRCYV